MSIARVKARASEAESGKRALRGAEMGGQAKEVSPAARVEGGRGRRGVDMPRPMSAAGRR